MAISPPGFLVDAPRIAAKPRYGLLTTLDPILLDDPHAWAGGVEWEQDLCTSVESFIDKCPPATGHVKSTERDLEFCHADPFIVKSSYDCSTVGRSVTEAFNIAKKRLLSWESHEVERIFWTGQGKNGPVNPSLTSGNDHCELFPEILSASGALGIVPAFAVLEEALTDVVPGGGIIHAPYGLASYMGSERLLITDNLVYYSPTGFPIVLGAGYSGSGPGNVTADSGTTWLFGTGPTAVWRSDYFMNPSELSEGIDRFRNDVTVFAERFYAVGFSCALFAVQVCL